MSLVNRAETDPRSFKNAPTEDQPSIVNEKPAYADHADHAEDSEDPDSIGSSESDSDSYPDQSDSKASSDGFGKGVLPRRMNEQKGSQKEDAKQEQDVKAQKLEEDEINNMMM